MVDLAKYLRAPEQVSCNLCGSDHTSLIHDRDRFGLNINTVICNNCGLIYLNSRPTEDSYRKMYESDYRVAVSSSDEWLEDKFQEQIGYANRWILPFFLRHYAGEINSLLDVGCAYGGLMLPLKQRYPDIRLYGIEPTIKMAEYAKYKTGSSIKVGEFEPGIFDEKFDLIIIARTLNHVLDPFEMLRLARSMLLPKGMLLIILQDAVTLLMIQGLDMFTEISHPYIFTRETIQCLISKAGFDVIGYEDGLFDPTKLSDGEIRSFSFKKRFRKMFILARVGGGGTWDYPDARTIEERVHTNSQFYQEYKDSMYTGTILEKAHSKLAGWKQAVGRRLS